MGRKLDNVISLYLSGVVDGHVLPAADKFLTESYVDHLAGGGRPEFVAGFQPLVARFDDRAVRPLRGFEDGSKVFLHSYQSFGRGQVERVRMDVFDTDAEDNLTQGWSVTVPLRATRTGCSPIDGTSVVDTDAATGANKRIVRGYAAGRADLDPAFTDHGALDRATLGPFVMVLGHGDFVTTLTTGPAGPVFDIFRVAAGRIIEHWDTR
jgi:predicted SnoaL-like aldol condensation-catalyzing enzyme